MKKPDPAIGQIVRYDFLWHAERDRGRDEGAKDRPCAVVATKAAEGSHHVYVVPITHREPQPGQSAVKIPRQVNKMSGLDEEQAWLITSEINRVNWSDPGIRPARTGQWLVGHLPRKLAGQAAREAASPSQQKTISPVDRIKANFKRDNADRPRSPDPEKNNGGNDRGGR